MSVKKSKIITINKKEYESYFTEDYFASVYKLLISNTLMIEGEQIELITKKI